MSVITYSSLPIGKNHRKPENHIEATQATQSNTEQTAALAAVYDIFRAVAAEVRAGTRPAIAEATPTATFL